MTGSHSTDRGRAPLFPYSPLCPRAPPGTRAELGACAKKGTPQPGACAKGGARGPHACAETGAPRPYLRKGAPLCPAPARHFVFGRLSWPDVRVLCVMDARKLIQQRPKFAGCASCRCPWRPSTGKMDDRAPSGMGLLVSPCVLGLVRAEVCLKLCLHLLAVYIAECECALNSLFEPRGAD